jgi:hypothetical protein
VRGRVHALACRAHAADLILSTFRTNGLLLAAVLREEFGLTAARKGGRLARSSRLWTADYEAGARNPVSVRTTLTRPSRSVSMSMPRTTGLPGGPKRHGMAAVSELV